MKESLDKVNSKKSRPLSARQVQDKINKEERCFDTFKLIALIVIVLASIYWWSRTGYAGLDDLVNGSWGENKGHSKNQ